MEEKDKSLSDVTQGHVSGDEETVSPLSSDGVSVPDDAVASAHDSASAKLLTDREDASSNHLTEKEGGEQPASCPDWRFGKEEVAAPIEGSRGTKHFAAVFSAVVGVCLALLIVLLFVGDAGIKIYRTVTHERTVFVENEGGENGLLSPEQAAELVRRSTVTVLVRTSEASGHGSGFIYTADGYICTNHHVVENAVSVQVVLPDGEAVDAAVIGSDAMADLAVLKIDKAGLTPLKLGSSRATLVGETVVAVGTPAKLDYAGTATFGKISATDRIVSLVGDDAVVTKKMTLLQTDASVNPGNSGGPLANMYGEVIGVVVMRVSKSGGTVYDGIGFAIPIDGAKIVLDAIIRDGYFSGENPVATGRSLLGIGGIGIVGGYWYSNPASSDRIQSQGKVEGYTYIPYDGVYVTAVNQPNSADKLKVGDIITKINGLNMYTVYDVINHVNRYPVYTTVTVTVMRSVGGAYEKLSVEIVLLEE